MNIEEIAFKDRTELAHLNGIDLLNIIEFLQKNGATDIVEVGSDLKEKSFPLPKEVRP